jgi:hypothetical protein
VNEVIPWTSRAGEWIQGAAVAARDVVTSAWDWLTDLGQGSWLLVLGVLAGGAVFLSVLMNHSTPSICDQTVADASDMRLYDGSHSLPPDATHSLHREGRRLAALAEKTSGQQRAALLTLARTANDAQTGHPFEASSALATYHGAC